MFCAKVKSMKSPVDSLKKYTKLLESSFSNDEKVISNIFLDVEKVKKDFESGNRHDVVLKHLEELNKVELKEEKRHKEVSHLFSDWKGDLKKEIELSKGTQAQQYLINLSRELNDLETNILIPATKRVEKFFKKLRSQLSKMVSDKNKDPKEYVQELKQNEEVLSAFNDAEHKLKEFIVNINRFISAYEVRSSELLHYKEASAKEIGIPKWQYLLNIRDGKGNFFNISIRQRQAMIARILRENNFLTRMMKEELEPFIQQPSVDDYGFSSGKDYSYMSLEEAEKHVFEGLAKKVLLEMLKSGKKPISMVDLMRTRVGIYKRLIEEGVPIAEIKNNALFRFWWQNWWTSGDLILSRNGKFIFQVGKKEFWEAKVMDKAEDSLHITNFNKTYIQEHYGLSKGEVKQDRTWLEFVQGDDVLLAAYVEIAFTLKGGRLMGIYQPNRDNLNAPGMKWRFWELNSLDKGQSDANSYTYVSHQNGFFFWV